MLGLIRLGAFNRQAAEGLQGLCSVILKDVAL